MIKKKGLGLSIISGAALLAACGSNTGADGQIELELFSNKAENVSILEELIADFEAEHENISITLESPPEAETVLRTRLTRGDMPDVMTIGGNATFGELGREGVLRDLSEEAFLDNVQPAYVEMLSMLVGTDVEGTFGVPYASNANGMIYNAQLFNELEMELPETWEDFIALLDQAESEGVQPIQFTLGDAWTALPTWNSLGGVLAPANFAELKEEGEASFQEDYRDVAERYLELLEYGEGDIFGIGYEDGNSQFANGEVLFYLQGNWAIPEIQNSNPDIELGFLAFPGSSIPEENNLVSGVDVLLAVSEDTDHSEEALLFIDYLMNAEVNETYINDQAAFSAVEGVVQEDLVFENIQSNFENGELASFPDHYYPAALGAENLIQDFLINQNVESFLETMDNEWENVSNR